MTTSLFSTKIFHQELKMLSCDEKFELRTHREIDSTSSELLRLLSEGALPGTIVAATRQTKGRGRSGNYWHSDDSDNLYISVAVGISGHIAERLPLVPLAAGVSAVETLVQVNIQNVQLKWPNDLLRYKKKVGGILCETPGIENDSAVAVVGMGLNLGTRSFPDELASIAANLVSPDSTPHPPHLREVIAAKWVFGLHKWCDRLMKNETSQLIAEWKRHCEPFGRRVRVGDIIGQTMDLNESGRLLIKKDDGVICIIPGGMVESLD